MTISFTPPTLTNTGQIGGNQSTVKTVALDNGGYVVVWQDSTAGSINCFFQRFDALGAQVGAATQIANPSQQIMLLQDVAVAGDGTFSIATLGRIGPSFADERVFVTSYSQTTGAQSGAQALVNLVPLGPNGTFNAQLVPNPAIPGSLTVLATVLDAISSVDVLKAVVTTAGALTVAPFNTFNNYPGFDLQEAVEGLGGQQIAIFSDGIIDTNSGFLNISTTRDIVSLAPGMVVVANGVNESPQVALTLMTGAIPGILGWSSTGGGISTNAPGLTSPGANIFEVELLDLGAGRILIVWVADGGDLIFTGALQDGVYAQVYNMFTGGPEGTATQILNFGAGSNNSFLAGISLGAEVMADGRVTVGMSYANGLSGLDVFNVVLDPRVAGVSLVASTALSETFVGTDFDDTFTGIHTGDLIFGGLGQDSVTFGGSAARSVDLQNPGSLPANTFTLSGIENLTGSSGADLFRGDFAANVLSGVAGNDTLYGRAGNDSLFGGTSDDLVFGGSADDLLDGFLGFDTLDGGDGDDLALGGADADRLLGGTGNDTLNGGDADDRLQGDADDDVLFGDAGNDILSGGVGNDELNGGAGLDTLRANDGADTVFGGADNDTISAHSGVALIDGGTGTDTLRVSDAFAVNSGGVHLDLTGVFDPFGLVVPLTRFDADISGIENVTGSNGNDLMTGDGAVNTLRGDLGNDTIVSGGGADILFGNGGADVFLFTGTTGGADQLRDYAIGTDRIGLIDGAFGDINAANIASRLTINATGTVGASALAQLIFDNAGAGFGQLSFDADGNGAGAAVVIAILSPTTGTLVALTAADFLLI